jgi:hypothetical protein
MITLTPNTRLAAQYGAEAQPFALWLSSWLKGQGNFKILSAFEECVLWEQMIQGSDGGGHLMQIWPTAELAVEATRIALECGGG